MPAQFSTLLKTQRRFGDFRRHSVKLPPEDMRFRVGGDPAEHIYINVGKRVILDFETALVLLDRKPSDFKTILDFGCGCCRVLKDWPISEGQSIYGTDIDKPMVEWSRQAYPEFHFNNNDHLPPLPYTDGQFDLIYSISVFSHLRQDYARSWSKELERISAPNALLLLSLHGSHLVPKEAMPKDGIMFQSTEFWKGSFPEWYGNLYASEAEVRKLFEPHFKVLHFIRKGIIHHQDLIMLTPA